MAASTSAPNHPCHTRSISLPLRSHPAALRVEEEIQKLRSNLASSSSTTPQDICDGLMQLGGLYESIKELICLTSFHQILIYPLQKRWVEEELDASIRLLDLCGAVKDRLTATDDHIHAIQSALGRRDSATITRKVNDYARSGKQADKDISNCFRFLKQMEDKCISDDEMPVVIRTFLEVRVLAIVFFQQLSFFFSIQSRRPKSSKWSFVSKTLSRRKVASEAEDGNGVAGLDIFSYFVISAKDVDGKRVLRAQSQLQSLEVSIKGLDNGLVCLFKKLIQLRVSLLNVLDM